ncbi:unnamed protein product, partial [Hapterophycus canaliculatus]
MLVSRSLLHRRAPAVEAVAAGAGAAAPAPAPQEPEPDRYAMHTLQAAYVRSVARTRLDLMKTLDSRREAALKVPGAGGVVAAAAAAAAVVAVTPGRRSDHGGGGGGGGGSGTRSRSGAGSRGAT